MEVNDTVDLAADIKKCAWIVEKVRTNKTYAQNLYAALCNIIWFKTNDFWPALTGNNEWSCSWRWAGGFVAELENQGGDYMDWYCSGIRGDKDDDKEYANEQYVGEGYVTNEVSDDLAKIGWKWKEYEDQGI